MNTFSKLPVITAALLAASLGLAGCSDEEPFQTPTINPTTGTGIADDNSFTLGRSPVAVEGLGFNGLEVTVTARAADRNNHPVPDGSTIHFLTNGGVIQPECQTTDGICTVIWTSQNPRPSNGDAIVLAYTEGEESFLDLNDNDNFDAGETVNDISEPFLDTIDNDIFDPGSEIFVDTDGNNVFDGPDGLYTGHSCIGDNTVCNRTTLNVWTDTLIQMSGSVPDITFFAATTSPAADEIVPITIVVVDKNNNQMAEETTVDISVTGSGTVDKSSFTVGAGSVAFSFNYTAGNPATPDIITVTTTGPTSNTPASDPDAPFGILNMN